MWEKNISQESIASNVNVLASKKPHGHRGMPALMCSPLTVDPWLGPACLLQVWFTVFKDSLWDFTKCIMNANSVILYTRVSIHLTTRDNINSTLEYIVDRSAL